MVGLLRVQGKKLAEFLINKAMLKNLRKMLLEILAVGKCGYRDVMAAGATQILSHQEMILSPRVIKKTNFSVKGFTAYPV